MRINVEIPISGAQGIETYTFKDQIASPEDLASLARLQRRANHRAAPLPHLDLHHDVQSFVGNLSPNPALNSTSQQVVKRRAVSEHPEQIRCAKRRCLDSYYDQTQHDGAMVGNLRHRRRPHKTAVQLKFEREKVTFPVLDQQQFQSSAESPEAASVEAEVFDDENNGAVISAKRLKRNTAKVLPSIELQSEQPSRQSREPEVSAELSSAEETSRGAGEEVSASPTSDLDGPADAEPINDASDSPRSDSHDSSSVSVETLESQSSASAENIGDNCDAGKVGSIDQEQKTDGDVQEQLEPPEVKTAGSDVETKWTRMRAKYNDKKPAAIFPDYGAQLVELISPPSKNSGKNKKSMRKGFKGGVKPTNTLGNTHFNENANKRKDAHRLGGKPFDLTSETARSQTHLPKKQCVDGVRSGSVSSTALIELESGSTQVSQCRDDSTSLSLYESSQGSPNKNKHSSSKHVSEFSNVDSKLKTGQKQKPLASSRYIQPRPSSNKRTAEALDHEDTEDPIDDAAIITGQRDRKPNTEARSQQLATYKGNSFLGPSRSILNSRKPGSTSKVTGPKSQYFAVTTGNKVGYDTPSKVKVTPAAHNPACNLSEAHTKHMQQQKEQEDKQIAGELLTKQKSNAKKLAAARNPEAADEITDDEDFRKKADMIPTKFGKSRQSTLSGPPRGTEFTVKQFFGVPGESLTKKGSETWHLVHDKEQRILRIFDASRQQLSEFSTKALNTVQYSTHSAKTVLRGSASVQFKQGLIVYLELASSEDCRDLRAELKKEDPTLGESARDVDHLDKVFIANSNKTFKPKQKEKSGEEVVPEDIRLAEQNSRRRQQEGWVEKQNLKPSSHISALTQPYKSSGVQKAQGLAKNMQGNSDTEKLNRPSQSQTIEPQNFYHAKPKASPADDPAHVTRASSRLAEKDMAPQASRQARSPSPERWTDFNPDWARDWKNESISYPEDTKAERRATVDKSDIRRLDDGEFLNDSLIGFYLRYLENELQKSNPNLAKRVYFQNSHFYESMKGKGGSINYAKVQRWTRKVDLFSKDYIVVPVNENYHWYVAIICNAPLLLGNSLREVDSENVGTKDIKEQTKDDSKLSSLASKSAPRDDNDSRRSSLEENSSSLWPNDNPGDNPVRSSSNNINAPNGAQKAGHSLENLPSSSATDKPMVEKAIASGSKKSTSLRKGESLKDRTRIIILDSLSGTHTNTMANLKNYLVAEMKDKKQTDISTSGIKGMNARNIPTQNNHYDCGPYLLSYVEKFLENPDEFIYGVFHNQNDLSITWRYATEMRDHIRKILFKLQKDFSPPQKPRKKVKQGGESIVKGTGDLLKADDTKGKIFESNTTNDVPLVKEPVFSSARSSGKNIGQTPDPVETYETLVRENKTTSSTRVTSGSTTGSTSRTPNHRNRNHSPTFYPRYQLLGTAQTSEFTRNDRQDPLELTSPANLIEPILNGSVPADGRQLSATTKAVDGNDDDEMLLPTEPQRTRQSSSSASITSSENINILDRNVVDLSQEESDEE